MEKQNKVKVNHKICSRCNIDKPWSEYHIRKDVGHPRGECKKCRCLGQKIYFQKNKTKVLANVREYYQKNKDKWRASSFKRKFNITLEDYNNLAIQQNHVCAICKSIQKHSNNEHLFVDHCHKTGKVRGLLCHKCNTAIGLMNDDPQLFEKAILYVKKTS